MACCFVVMVRCAVAEASDWERRERRAKGSHSEHAPEHAQHLVHELKVPQIRRRLAHVLNLTLLPPAPFPPPPLAHTAPRSVERQRFLSGNWEPGEVRVVATTLGFAWKPDLRACRSDHQESQGGGEEGAEQGPPLRPGLTPTPRHYTFCFLSIPVRFLFFLFFWGGGGFV